MPAPDDRLTAESWFLARGLPAVLTQRARLRRVWSRSAPALAAFGAISVCMLTIYLLTGSADIDVDGTPTTVEWFVLAILLLSLPLAAVVGWLVSRMTSDRTRAAISALSVVVAFAAPAIPHDDLADFAATGVIVALVFSLTASGLGSVLGWAVRLTLSQLAAVGDLLVGALPVVLLTVLVFFNSPVWAMASTISRGRLWLAVAFMVLIAATFVVSRLLNQAKPTLESATVSARHAERLEGTPFTHLPDLAEPVRLTRLERFNVVFVLAVTQIAQILMVAIVTGMIFLLLGLIVLSPELLAQWTRNGPSDGMVLGMTIPVPQALIHVTMFLSALTFMFVSARAVGDAEYRARFLDPLIDDLKLTLLARNRYRAHVYEGTRGSNLDIIDVRVRFLDVPPPAEPAPGSDLFGRRYGEVLLVHVGPSGPEATVYNTFPLNDCPQELWSKLDAQALAKEHGAAAALLNGPRYWLMNSIEKAVVGEREIATFGGIDMIRQATVALTSMNPAPYLANTVARHAVFVFNSGTTVFELIDPEGRTWVMQSWSQVLDPTLGLDDLAGLVTRLGLPDGWSFRPRVLDEGLRIDTSSQDAQVLQDDLTNSYSLASHPRSA